jgi:hypothetical protein
MKTRKTEKVANSLNFSYTVSRVRSAVIDGNFLLIRKYSSPVKN